MSMCRCMRIYTAILDDEDTDGETLLRIPCSRGSHEASILNLNEGLPRYDVWKVAMYDMIY